MDAKARRARLRSPLRWPGGKSRLAAAILSHVGEHQTYVEACCGSAAVFWAKPREVSKAEVLNDLDGELINFYQVLHRRGRRLATEVDAMPYSRRLLRRMLTWRPTGAFARARRFWYIDRVVFGAKQRGGSFGVRLSGRSGVLPQAILANLDATIERLRGVAFECVDVARLVAVYDRPTTLFYVDPPYWGLSQDYAVRFGVPDHQRLRDALGAAKAAWLLSYNDCPQVRALYKGYATMRLQTLYMMGLNARSGGGQPGRRRSLGRELLISNRPLRRAP